MLQLIKCLIKRGWQTTNTSPFALFIAVVAWINLLGFTWVNTILDAIKTSRDHRSHGKIGVAAMVCALQFDIGGSGLTPTEERGYTDCLLTVVITIRNI